MGGLGWGSSFGLFFLCAVWRLPVLIRSSAHPRVNIFPMHDLPFRLVTVLRQVGALVGGGGGKGLTQAGIAGLSVPARPCEALVPNPG